MGKILEKLEAHHETFIGKQPLFFVATATAESTINLSPKGMDTFRVLGPSQAAYLDLTGSGNETAAHVRKDGRITIMFCSFDKKPLIIRLRGKGAVIGRKDPEWQKYSDHFEEIAGARQIILIEIDTVQESCGYAVPFMELSQERKLLCDVFEAKEEAEISEYWEKKNQRSIDGIDTGINKHL
ncbi:MAG: pyridoxamine 5'-phosphate oxidase family protein [Verrucomicrobiota bacterium]